RKIRHRKRIRMTGMETYLEGSALVAVGAAFTGGALAGLSPCVYPMIPIVSAYVISRSGAEKSRIKSFLLSLAYVVGMAAVYSLLGMVAALTGSMFGQISTSPWALLVVAIILLLFALNILDVIPLPARFSGRTWEPAAGGVPGYFLLGAASGLVASPLHHTCTIRTADVCCHESQRRLRSRLAVRLFHGHGHASARCRDFFGIRRKAAQAGPLDGNRKKGARTADAGAGRILSNQGSTGLVLTACRGAYMAGPPGGPV